MKKILFIYSDTFTIYDIAWAFLELGYEMEFYNTKFFTYKSNKEDADILAKHLEAGDYWFILSYNFIPDISRVCHQKKLPYVAWTYDSLTLSIHDRTLVSPYNFIHVFDREEYLVAKTTIQHPHIYYMPLAANLNRLLGTVITPEDETRFTSEVAFVGNMYDSDEFQKLEDNNIFPPAVLDYFESLFDYYTGRWNGESIYDCLDPDSCRVLNNFLPDGYCNHYDIDDAYYYAFILLGRRIANKDRLLMLSNMAKHFDISLFGPKKELPFSINQKGSVKYPDEFVKVAFLSKINLHLTIPRISTGISLRCFDIMGCGGFLMANYRNDMVKLFAPDEDFVVYNDIDELIRKTEYYLQHNEKRMQIAANGFEKIKNAHTCTHRAKEMIMHLEEAGMGLGFTPVPQITL